jgi:lysozyme family protein
MRFEDVQRGYANMWNTARLRPEKRDAALNVAARVIANRARYESVSRNTGVPWWWIGAVHQLEGGGNFATHLHNGDSLTGRTVHVPAGRPPSGEPPFTWQISATDALELKGLHKVQGWTIERALWEWERFNGLGYFGKGVNSPYVWSFTTHYTAGKYIADGQYDPTAVSKQCGAAAILLSLIELGAVSVQSERTTTMQQLKANIQPFAGLAPTLIGMIGGPLTRIAVKAIAEALGTDPDADKVVQTLEKAPLQKTIEALTQAEGVVQQIEQAQIPPAPAPVVVPVKPTVSPIDKAIGMEGWKTYIGLAIAVIATVASNMGFLSSDVFQLAMGAASLIGGAGIIAKIDRWLGWLPKRAGQPVG